MKETGDHGPINAWGRDRFWPLDSVTEAQRKAYAFLDAVSPSIIENNRIWHSSDWAVDLDDGSSNYIVRNNLLLNSGVKFREGYRRISTNNIFVNGGQHSHVSYPNNEDEVTKNIFLTPTPYFFIRADTAASGILYDNNTFWNNGGAVSGITPSWQASYDMNSVTANPLMAESPWSNSAMTDYTVGSASPAIARGFKNIPMGNFGRPGAAGGPPPVTLSGGTAVVETRESLSEPWLGASVTGLFSDTLASSVGLSGRNGLYVASVPAGSVAASFSLRAGDVVRSIDGTTVSNKNSFWAVWNSIAAGSSVSLGVWRGQAAVTVGLTRPAGVEKLNNTSGVSYTGAGWGWRGSDAGGYASYLNDLDASTTAGDSFSLSFNGTGLKAFTQTNSDESVMQFSVDGGPSVQVDLRSPGRIFQTLVFDTGALSNGPHTVTGTSSTGGYSIVDSFEITRSVVSPTTARSSQSEFWLGATVTGVYSSALAASAGLNSTNGLYVVRVPAGTSAATAGLLAGDVVTSFNGAALTDSNSFWRAWNVLPVGGTAALIAQRNGSTVSVSVTHGSGVEKLNNTSGILYSGAGWDWKSASRGGAGSYLNDLDASTSSGDSFSFTFTGTRLRWITQKNSDEAVVRVSVDGRAPILVDLRSSSRIYQAVVFDTGLMASGAHTLTFASTTPGYFLSDQLEVTR